MPTKNRRRRQDSTAQQLRSFNEVARLESFSDAARSLELSVPTVWHQVKLLEDEFGESLLERVGRGVRLTEAGSLLAELSEPLVREIADLKDRFRQCWSGRKVHFHVAASPRIFLEDMPPCVSAFRGRHDDVFLAIGERLPAQIPTLVASSQADLGFLVGSSTRDFDARNKLDYQTVYPLEVRLVISKKHPLARRQGLRLEHLAAVPFFSSLNAAELPESRKILDQAGMTQAPVFAKVYFSQTVRRYVLQENGAGLVLTPPSLPADPGLVETAQPGLLGEPFVYSVRRKGPTNPHADEFIALMRTSHTAPQKRRRA